MITRAFTYEYMHVVLLIVRKLDIAHSYLRTRLGRFSISGAGALRGRLRTRVNGRRGAPSVVVFLVEVVVVFRIGAAR